MKSVSVHFSFGGHARLGRSCKIFAGKLRVRIANSNYRHIYVVAVEGVCFS